VSLKPRKRSRHPKDRLIAERRGGVLVVASDDRLRAHLLADLAPLETPTLEMRTTSEALELLSHDASVDVLIALHEQSGMSGGALCQYVRAHAALASIHTLLIADQNELANLRLAGRVADDVLSRTWESGDLRVAVRSALRAQARRRLIARRERRHAIDWLAMVLSHEINNPLAAAMANLGLVRDRVTDHESSELLDESFAMLERIRDSTHAIRLQARMVGAEASAVDPERLVETLQTTLARHGRQLSINSEIGGPIVGRVRWGLLVDATDAVVENSLSYCDGAISVRIHVEEARLAFVVLIGGRAEEDPEIILEPRLLSKNGEPPRFYAGLSMLEQSFAEAGGQLFARPVNEGWRFGIIMPVEPMGEDVPEV
jgi:CheY-like chemotaxis protein